MAAAAFAGLVSSQAAVAVPVLSVSPSASPAVVGTPLTIDVRVTDITDLYAYQFTLAFDPTILSVTAASEGGFLGSASATTFFDGGSFDNTLGRISFSFNSIIGTDPGVSGSGLLVRYSFNVLNAGVTGLNFSDLIFLNSALNDISLTAPGSNLQTVAAIPEPESLALFALGLGALALARRRRAG